MHLIRKARLALALLTAAGMAAPASAQTITFGAAHTSAADTDVLNTGTTFLAFAFQNSNSTVTVNGVTFAYANFGTVGNLTTSGFNGGAGSFTSANAPFSNLSASYQALLSGGEYVVPSGPATFTVSGLTAGDQYEAQFFVSDPRSFGAGRAETLTGGTTLSYNSTGQDGGVGQFANSSVFTAGALGKATFTVTSSGSASSQSTQANAFQVRDLGAAPVPEASTTVSLGLLLALGLGGLVVSARRKASSAR